MLSSIEQQVSLFLEAACDGKAAFPENLIEEFGERCKGILRSSFLEREQSERKFYLRMSNIGRPLRQLMLDKTNGSKFSVSTDFKLKATVGHIYEAFMLALLKVSGVNVIDHDKQVKLQVYDTIIPGTYDVKIDCKIYDIKTASPFAYDYKFTSLDALRNGDAFGYFAQGFGYALADDSPFGGWIVINKATGQYKVLEIPEQEHDSLRDFYNQEIHDKVRHITTTDVIPACTGVVDEYFRKKLTGNKVLNRECEWCDHKFSCHKDLQPAPEAFSGASSPKLKYYLGKILKPGDSEE